MKNTHMRSSSYLICVQKMFPLKKRDKILSSFELSSCLKTIKDSSCSPYQSSKSAYNSRSIFFSGMKRKPNTLGCPFKWFCSVFLWQLMFKLESSLKIEQSEVQHSLVFNCFSSDQINFAHLLIKLRTKGFLIIFFFSELQ